MFNVIQKETQSSAINCVHNNDFGGKTRYVIEK